MILVTSEPAFGDDRNPNRSYQADGLFNKDGSKVTHKRKIMKKKDIKKNIIKGIIKALEGGNIELTDGETSWNNRGEKMRKDISHLSIKGAFITIHFVNDFLDTRRSIRYSDAIYRRISKFGYHAEDIDGNFFGIYKN